MIRRATPEDYPAISKMLSDEGIEDQVHDKHESWVYDNDGIKGFYTIDYVNGCPSFGHFCIRKDARKGKAVISLLNHFILWCHCNGYKHAYAHAPKDKPAIKRLIEHFTGVTPYYENERNYWYYF